MAYWNAAGLAATRAVEGGSYTAHDPNSSASGAYSFLTSTWQTYAPQAGVDINQYPYAYLAPPAAQDAVAAITPVSNWGGSWAGSGGANASNPLLTQATPMSTPSYSQPPGYGTNFTPPAGTPDTFGTSVTPGSQTQNPLPPGSYVSGGTDPNIGDPSTAADAPYGDLTDIPDGLQQEGYYGGALHVNVTPQTVGNNPTGTVSGTGTTNPQGVTAQPGAGTPIQVNLSPQTASDFQSYVTAPITAAENAIKAYLASISNWFVRAALILLAIVIIFVALWRLSGGTNQQLAASAKGLVAA